MNYSDTSYVHVSPPSGTLRYWIRAVGGCFNSLDSVLLSSDSTSSITLKNSIGIEEQLAHIKCYPQPMQNKVVFDGLEGAVNLDVQIFEVSGRLLRSEIIETSGDKFEVEVSDLKNGVYVFVLSWADYSTAIKLVKHE